MRVAGSWQRKPGRVRRRELPGKRHDRAKRRAGFRAALFSVFSECVVCVLWDVLGAGNVNIKEKNPLGTWNTFMSPCDVRS